MNEQVGFIGLGVMGRGMATNLVRAGLPLLVNDMVEAACNYMAEQGAEVVSQQELAKRSSIIMLSLPNGNIVRTVIFGEDGLAAHIRPGSIICDVSSVKPAEVKEFSEKLEAIGCAYVDAPVSGGSGRAASGELSIMMGGTDDQYKRLLPVFRIIGKESYHVGSVGSGSKTKLVNQIVVTMNVSILGEAFAFAEKAGLNLKKVIEVIMAGSGESFMLRSRSEKILKRDFVPGGTINIHTKDIRNVLSTAEELGITLPMTETMLGVLEQQIEEGNGQLDSSSLILHYEKAFGLDKGE